MTNLKPEVSLGVGLATATLVFGIHQAALPSYADMRSVDADNADLQSATNVAGWTSAAVVAGISLVAKDATIFIVGGTMVVALQWWAKHADAVTPAIGKAALADMTPRVAQADAPELYAVPDTPQYASVI